MGILTKEGQNDKIGLWYYNVLGTVNYTVKLNRTVPAA